MGVAVVDVRLAVCFSDNDVAEEVGGINDKVSIRAVDVEVLEVEWLVDSLLKDMVLDGSRMQCYEHHVRMRFRHLARWNRLCYRRHGGRSVSVGGE